MGWKERATVIQPATDNRSPAVTTPASDWKSRATPVQSPEEGLIGRFVEGAEDVVGNVVKPIMENVVAPIGKVVDTYSGAPMRAAIGAAQNKQNPIDAFSHQFGNDPTEAPTGKELAKRMGFGETSLSEKLPNLYSESGKEFTKFKRGGLLDPTASGAAGLGLDIVADPTNVIPFGALAEGAGKLAKGGGNLATKLVGGLIKGGAEVSDIATGTKVATNAVDKVGEVAGAIKRTLTPNKFHPSYEKNVTTAAKLGIKPEELLEATRRGKLSLESRMERTIGEGPMGQQVMDNFSKNAAKIENGVDQALHKASSGLVRDPLEAGEAIRSSYSAAEKKLLEGSNITYKTAADLTPAMQLTADAAGSLKSTIAGLKKRAQGYIARGATNEQVGMGRNLMGLATRLEKNGGNFRQLADQIGFIGEAMTDPALNRVHASELRKVYHTLSDALIDTVHDIHPDLGAQLKGNNKKMSEFFKSRDALGSAIQSGKSNPESLFKNLTMDANKIDQLKKIMPPQEFNSFRGSYLNSLIKRNSEGILWETSLQSLKKNQGRLGRMFNEAELKEVVDYLELGASQGSPIHPGSGAGRVFHNIKEGVLSGMTNKEVLKQINKRAGLLPDLNKTQEIIIPKGLKEATLGTNKGSGLIGKLPRRGPKELRLKAAQSIAPSTYRESKE